MFVALPLDIAPAALISEAWHNFSDALALVLSWIAVWLQSRPATAVKTFGYRRAGVLAAFVNAASLVGISLYIFYEAYQRFQQPSAVNAPVMIGVAIIGLAMNGAIALALSIFQGRREHPQRLRAHDRRYAGLAGVLIGAILIRLTGVAAIDPVLSVLIAVADSLDVMGHHRGVAEHPAQGSPARHSARSGSGRHARR